MRFCMILTPGRAFTRNDGAHIGHEPTSSLRGMATGKRSWPGYRESRAVRPPCSPSPPGRAEVRVATMIPTTYIFWGGVGTIVVGCRSRLSPHSISVPGPRFLRSGEHPVSENFTAERSPVGEDRSSAAAAPRRLAPSRHAGRKHCNHMRIQRSRPNAPACIPWKPSRL
jgi:hypothetical protein